MNKRIYPLLAVLLGAAGFGLQCRAQTTAFEPLTGLIVPGMASMLVLKIFFVAVPVIALLCALPLAEGPCKEALNQLNTLLPHGDYHGRALGIAQSEPIAGDLTVAFTLLEVTETGLTGRFDSRVPLCATKENCENVARAAFEQSGFTFEGEQEEAHHTPADSPFVQTLLKRYEEYTGQKGECLSTGGGTYVHEIPGGVAFGCTMPGFDTHLHGADERVKIADLMLSAKLFAHIILDMCAE